MKTQCRPTFILLTILALAGWSVAAELDTVYEWKYIDFEWDENYRKADAESMGVYNREQIIPVDFQKIPGNRVVVTTPRYYDSPATLSVISEKSGDGGPLLKPYPDWEWNNIVGCSGLTSVSRVYLDKCNRLWVVDSGKIGNERVCPAQILAFNAENDELLETTNIPENLSRNSKDSSKGHLEVQFVETKGDSCEETWIYIADPEGNGLVISHGEDIWRLENDNVFAPESRATTYSIGGEDVTLEIGTSILTIPPPGFIDEDYLLLRPMSSFSDYAVKVEELHNSKDGSSVTYYKGNITLPSQELVRAFSDSGVLVGALASSPVVACWYLGNPLATDYVGTPLEDVDALQFTSAGKIVKGDVSGFENEEYWLLTNRLHKYVQGTLDLDDINFRLLKVNIADLVEDTVCAPSANSRTAGTIQDKFFFEYETTDCTITADNHY